MCIRMGRMSVGGILTHHAEPSILFDTPAHPPNCMPIPLHSSSPSSHPDILSPHTHPQMSVSKMGVRMGGMGR